MLDAVGGDAHLLGHSFGAVCCLLASMRTPGVRSLVLYEPPLRIDRFDIDGLRDVQAALDDGDPDHALDLLFPLVDISADEAAMLRLFEQAWQGMCDGVRQAPREGLAMYERRDELTSFTPPDVPTLYLYGEHTDAPCFATLDEVGDLLPSARLQCLPGQRHLAFGFDPGQFAETVLAFTSDYDKQAAPHPEG